MDISMDSKLTLSNTPFMCKNMLNAYFLVPSACFMHQIRWCAIFSVELIKKKFSTKLVFQRKVKNSIKQKMSKNKIK
jgi:hypothetical protein